MRINIWATFVVVAAWGCGESRGHDTGAECAAGGNAETGGRCGDGERQGTEECDTGGETWECDASCHRMRLYTACGAMSDCRDGQGCISGVCTTTCMQVSRGGVACPSADIPEQGLGVVCDLVPVADGNYGYCRPVCSAPSDCPAALRCDDGVCVSESAGALDE